MQPDVGYGASMGITFGFPRTLCLAASHAAAGNALWLQRCTAQVSQALGENLKEMKVQGSNLLRGCIQAHLQCKDPRAGLI